MSSPLRYEIRAASLADCDDLVRLARHLDSVNLPDDPARIEASLRKAERSFGGTEGDPRRREYIFVLYDRQEQRCVGTSLIVGQLGRRDAPYTYFEVRTEERYSQTVDRYFVHKVLSIGYSYNGPTEIGGLVMDPEQRRSPLRLGMLISYVRFLWIAMNRADFQSYVLAELMPPLQPDGTSHLWEAVGRHFTGMSYREADRLSRNNKEFIRALFPDGDIYASLLPEAAQAVIGQVGPKTRGVRKILERIGFRYVERVDPFDGGPHFAARTDEISLVRAARQLELAPDASLDAAPMTRVLVARAYDGPPWFRAIPTTSRLEPAGGALQLDFAVLEALELEIGAKVWVLPLP